MNTFELTKEAKEDLRKIARFTDKRWGRDQRFLYIKHFDDVFHLLAKTPSVGKKCDYIKNGYRKFPQSSHIIFYLENANNKIFVIRILHKSMDAGSKF
ncbi:MAG: type II toxin-antitoxin system RelE/ParE family toxin [Gammaproteobacteria bacterium]|nr:type II toxin-antitoxin system RelE/ParE family toxin [Gammaproteobacteria bacterium]